MTTTIIFIMILYKANYQMHFFLCLPQLPKFIPILVTGLTCLQQ